MKRSKRNAWLYCNVALSLLLTTYQASAASFTVVDGETVTATQYLADPGDVGTIEQGGTLDVNGNAIVVYANGAAINNAGLVNGGIFSGIYVLGSEVRIENSGTITGDLGIFATGGNATINNSDVINSGQIGIDATGNYDRITNSGTTTGGFVGILSQGDNSTTTNSGTATGVYSGIYNAGTGTTTINSGTVTGVTYGVWRYGENGEITNSGTATGGYDGIYVGGNDNMLTNSGRLVGGTNAVELDGTGNTLTLLKGSHVEGNLALGGASNTLIIGRGFADAALAFTGTPDIDTSAVHSVVADGLVYVVNKPGYLTAQTDVVNDLTRVVTDTVESRLAAARLTGGGGMSVAMNGVTIAATADVSIAPSNGFWLSGIGSYRNQQGNGNDGDFSTTLGGLIGGLDGIIAEGTRVGMFGGFGIGITDADTNSQEFDNRNFFGGVYLGQDWGHSFADLSVTAGWSNFDTNREVLNNMVNGGIEEANSDYGGFLFNPSLTVGTNIAAGPGTFTPSIRVSYAGLFLESYHESGSAAADMKVDSRDINIFDVRGELAYTMAASEFAGGTLHQTMRVGLSGTISDAGNFDATLAGQALNFDVSSDNLVRGYVGYDAVLAITDGASLNLTAEAGYDSTDAVTLQVDGGLTFRF